ncbi:hypothetical protein RhiirA5_412820, partial [Rhizophagus irregularis]
IAVSHKVYGITQDQETKNYMVVLKDICEKCKIMCNSIYFQRDFNNWTSGNNDIDEFIQNTQISEHDDIKRALEWIPYNKLYNIKYIADDKSGKMYKARWTDGCISDNSWNSSSWDDENQNWEREDQHMFVILKILNNPASITLELFINKIAISHKVYGITQDPKTENYMVVFKDICGKCDKVCNSMYFQRNFNNWTSGNNDIDKFIQYTQLSAHDDIKRALEWIPYNKLFNIKYIADCEFGKVYSAKWTNGYINEWDDENQNWKRKDQNMFVILKILKNPASITLEFINKV